MSKKVENYLDSITKGVERSESNPPFLLIVVDKEDVYGHQKIYLDGIDITKYVDKVTETVKSDRKLAGRGIFTVTDIKRPILELNAGITLVYTIGTKEEFYEQLNEGKVVL